MVADSTPNGTHPPVVVDSSSDDKPAETGCFGRKKKEKDTGPTSREPKDLKITQQTLPASKPVLRPVWVITVFLVIAVVFIPIGAMCLYFGDLAKEVSYRYDEVCLEQHGLAGNSTEENFQNEAALTCTVDIVIEDDMDGPVFVYYEIKGMYQNFRRYVRSHMDQQLAQDGNWEGSVDVETQSQSCVPLPYNPENDTQILNPCGLVAWSKFNDSYTMYVNRTNPNMTDGPLFISATGIAFEADIKYRFADIPATNIYRNNANGSEDLTNIKQFGLNNLRPEDRGGGNITGTFKEDERFINWMRLAHMPKFRKLWGRINDQDLKKGDVLTVSIINQYNTYQFSGHKTLVLSTTTWLGGNSMFLGGAYVAVGGLSFVFAIVYFIITKVYPRKIGDISLLNRKQYAP
eukprot:gene19868-26562_t